MGRMWAPHELGWAFSVFRGLGLEGWWFRVQLRLEMCGRVQQHYAYRSRHATVSVPAGDVLQRVLVAYLVLGLVLAFHEAGAGGRCSKVAVSAEQTYG